MKINIEIDNLTEAQAIAIEEFLAAWYHIGNAGDISIWTGMFCDSKVDWNPQITIDGREPQRFMKDIGLRLGKVKMLQWDESEIIQNMYFCDPYKIESALNENDELNESNEELT